MRENLLNLYIRHNSTFKTLSGIALSQLILKILYTRPLSDIKQVKSDLNTVVNGEVKNQDVLNCLIKLTHEKKVCAYGKSYSLSTDCKALIEHEIDNFKILFDDIIQIWFSKSGSQIDNIKEWFEKSLIKFFEVFHLEWVSELRKDKSIFRKNGINIERILDASFNENNITNERDKEWLKRQFLSFLESPRSEDNKLLWLYGTARFQAKLIDSRLFTDSLSIENFRNGTLVLDTNVLMILGLEGFELASSLVSLEKCFKRLDIKLKYLPITEKEYKIAIDSLRARGKSVFKFYNKFVLEALAVTNAHIATMLKRGCKTEEDIDNFFDQFRNIPLSFNEEKNIEILDSEEICHKCSQGGEDELLKEKINNLNMNIKGRPKRPNALIHDAGLLTAVHYLNEQSKTWLLTKDSTIIKYAIENTLRDEKPIAVSIIVLMNLLTYSNQSFNFDPQDFAPLFATLIKLSLIPEEKCFNILDLEFMLKTVIDINKLPDDVVVDIASELNTARLKGCTDEEATLMLQRRFMNETFTLTEDLDKTKTELHFEKSEKKKIIEEKEAFEETYRKRRADELRDRYDTKIRNGRLLFFILQPSILLVGFYFLLKNITSMEALPQIISNIVISGIFTVITSSTLYHPKIYKKYTERNSGIEEEIKEEIKQMKNK